MRDSEVLYAAAEYIRKHGWMQNSLGPDGGPRCMAGACYSVSDFYRVPDVVREVCGNSISEFNDCHCETANDAIAALEIAADIAAAEGH